MREQPEPHDFINLTSCTNQGISNQVTELYGSGLSLRAISTRLGRSKNFVRTTLNKAKIPTRPFNTAIKCGGPSSIVLHSGITPFGYSCLRGRLILDAKEIEIVQQIINHWQLGMSYSAIARFLNGKNIRCRIGKRWWASSIRAIIIRHKDKPINI